MSEEMPLVELTIPAPDQAAFESAKAQLTAAKQSWGITSPEDFEVSGRELSAIKALQKQLEEKRTAITKPLNEALKRINDLFRPPRDALEQAEALRKGEMLKWREAQARIARAEQARLDDLARREREALARKAAEAEQKAKEKADALRAAATTKEEREMAEKLAWKKQEDARIKAEALRLQAERVVAPTVAAPVVKAAGHSTREQWTFEVIDITLLPREYILANEAKIGAVVRATRGTVPIPGVRIIRQEVMSSRSGS